MATTKGFFKVKLSGFAGKKTGEQKLLAVEKELRKQDIPFVEDFDNDDTVIVRYGLYVYDEIWDFAQEKAAMAAAALAEPIAEPIAA